MIKNKIKKNTYDIKCKFEGLNRNFPKHQNRKKHESLSTQGGHLQVTAARS